MLGGEPLTMLERALGVSIPKRLQMCCRSHQVEDECVLTEIQVGCEESGNLFEFRQYSRHGCRSDASFGFDFDP